MTTFKVGDKVRVLDVSAIKRGEKHYFNGMETEVVSMYDGITGRYPKLRNKYGDPGISIHSQELHAIELIKTKPTKNQRITALEKKVEELQAQIDELKQPKEVAEDIWDFPPQLTNNQKRKAIIEKAKKFVEEHGEGFAFDFDGNVTCAARLVKLEGEVGYEAQIGYSKCHPQEVKNDFIGKAIALGRAKHINVSEFEQAVQPDEVVVGMETEHYHFDGAPLGIYKVDEISTPNGKIEIRDLNRHAEYHLAHVTFDKETNDRITNDTNAVY